MAWLPIALLATAPCPAAALGRHRRERRLRHHKKGKRSERVSGHGKLQFGTVNAKRFRMDIVPFESRGRIRRRGPGKALAALRGVTRELGARQASTSTGRPRGQLCMHPAAVDEHAHHAAPRCTVAKGQLRIQRWVRWTTSGRIDLLADRDVPSLGYPSRGRPNIIEV